MKRIPFAFLALLLTTSLGAQQVFAQVPLNLTYQGYLTDADGNPISDESATLFFRLYDESTGGTALWVERQTGVILSDGIFAVQLGRVEELDPNLFKGELYLSVAAGGEETPELAPRIPLAAAPYSVRAARLDEAALKAGSNVSIAPDADGALVIAAESVGEDGPDAWQLTGNAGTDPATEFVGTTDNVPLEMRANGARVMRYEPETGSGGPNVLGGWSGNSIGVGVEGATIAGGGNPDLGGDAAPNQVEGDYGTIGGGAGNAATNFRATVSGGLNNTASGSSATIGGGRFGVAGGNFTTVSGGSSNRAEGGAATVGGGVQNRATGDRATVGGGSVNEAGGADATIPGGVRNIADGAYSFAAGRRAKARHDGTFVWADSDENAPVAEAADFASTASDQFLIRAAGGVGIGTDSPSSQLTVSGTVESTVGGFKLPDGTVLAAAADLGGGDESSTAWQLDGNAGTDPATDFFGTTDDVPLELRTNDARVMRFEPQAGDDGPNVIGGASVNSVADKVSGATIAGGGRDVTDQSNQVLSSYGTVGGGRGNTANSSDATVGGGSSNEAGGVGATVSGGTDNNAGSQGATIGGGEGNTADGLNATVPGGTFNDAKGDFSFAAGTRAKATHNGAFVWNAFRVNDFTSTGQNQFLIRAPGGVGIGTNAPQSAVHVSSGTSGDAELILEADIDNDNEQDNPFISFIQDGGAINAFLGLIGDPGDRASGTLENAFLIGSEDDNPHLQFLTNDEVRMTVRKEGDIGLGTNAPVTRLHTVADRNGADTDPASHAAFIENTSTEANADVLALKVGTPGFPNTNVNFVTMINGDGDVLGQIHGNGIGGVAFRSRTGDYAEFLPRLDPNEAIQAGDVVGVVGGRVTKKTEEAEQVMVVSSRAIIEGNMPRGDAVDRHELVAMLGQVPVRVRGSVEAGDFIVPSGRSDGTAVAVAPEAMELADFTQVIGRAWDSLPLDAAKEVNVAVGLDQVGAMIDQLRQQGDRIDRQQATIERMVGLIEGLQVKVRDLQARAGTRSARRAQTGKTR